MANPQDARAVFTCFTVPGIVAGSLVGAVMHTHMRGMGVAALKGAVVGGGGATAVGAALAFALRAAAGPA
jgi:hypothetical protein